LSKLRLTFERTKEAKYVAHLDMLRMFERSFRRAGINISYSEGFNPRPKMVFAMPMSVGLTSDNEYMDIEMGNMENIQKEALDKISKQLNMALPSGIRIKDICLSTARENIMQAVKLATYQIKIEIEDTASLDNPQYAKESILEIINKQEIMVMKKTKKGNKLVNIRPLIRRLDIEHIAEGYYLISAVVSAGAENNLRPDLLVMALTENTGLNIDICTIHRSGLYTETEKGRILDLCDMEQSLWTTC